MFEGVKEAIVAKRPGFYFGERVRGNATRAANIAGFFDQCAHAAIESRRSFFFSKGRRHRNFHIGINTEFAGWEGLIENSDEAPREWSYISEDRRINSIKPFDYDGKVPFKMSIFKALRSLDSAGLYLPNGINANDELIRDFRRLHGRFETANRSDTLAERTTIIRNDLCQNDSGSVNHFDNGLIPTTRSCSFPYHLTKGVERREEIGGFLLTMKGRLNYTSEGAFIDQFNFEIPSPLMLFPRFLELSGEIDHRNSFTIIGNNRHYGEYLDFKDMEIKFGETGETLNMDVKLKDGRNILSFSSEERDSREFLKRLELMESFVKWAAENCVQGQRKSKVAV